jgi:A/G-specific adenine glycosylase
VIAGRSTALLDWYRTAGRDLPWRSTTDPYRILVSEVMLQQTQVPRVVPRYLRFLERFPTADDLAAAPLRDVLAEWHGLGYNSRARRLWEAARAVAADGWPSDAAGLRSLPGVGPYTAAAVASFAFGERVPAVDTNLRRVVARWLGRPLAGRALDEAAAALVPDESADWNQAVMDLAASICRPAAPRCSECPVAEWCADPTVPAVPSRQPPFRGSLRQVRGAIVRHLAEARQATAGEIAAATGHPEERVREAAEALAGDGLIAAAGPGYRLGE